MNTPFRVILLAAALCTVIPALRAQTDSAAAPVPSESRADSASATATAPALRADDSPASILLRPDTLAFMDYRHAGDIAATQGGFFLYDLGSPGQPGWLGRHGSSPFQSALLRDGVSTADLLTGQADLTQLATEDAAVITLYPMHQSFWHAGSGMLAAVDMTPRRWDAPRPYTRIRHAEGPYDELFTDVQFAINPGAADNLFLGVTRATVGSTATTDPARFANTRAERWHLRAEYRRTVSDLLTLRLSNEYTDQIVFMNGGIRRDLSAALPLFPDRSVAGFADSAFNEITAAFLNPHYRAQAIRNDSRAEASFDWGGDSTMVSSAALSFQLGKREATNSAQPLLRTAPDTAYGETLDRTDRWNLVSFRLRHRMDLRWAELDARADAGWFVAPGSALPSSVNGLTGSAAAMLRLPYDRFRLSMFARADHQRSETASGAGATIEILRGTFMPWLGIAFTSRIPSLIENYSEGLDSIATVGFAYGHPFAPTGNVAPALDATPVSAQRAHERSFIAEGGVRIDASWLEADLRASYRSTAAMTELYNTFSSDSDFAGTRWYLTYPASSERTLTVLGLSFHARVMLWKFSLENTVSLTSYESGEASPLAPKIDDEALLYFRGTLIEGTLQVKAGGRFSYRSSFAPTGFDPATGVFALPGPEESRLSGARSFTDRVSADLFLYATIKDAATLHVVLHNLLNARFITTRFFPAPDRGITFGVNWVFLD
ncbi:MAG: hypothetical protein IPP94_08980 [Ignavibacteria bacterium]|nr:hypothetical protein [Ignavibacteria bacterium]